MTVNASEGGAQAPAAAAPDNAGTGAGAGDPGANVDPGTAGAPAAGDPGTAGQPGASDPGTGGDPANPVAAAAAKADAALQDAEGKDTWYSGLPKETHEKLKDFSSLDDALSAIEKGQKFAGVEGVESYEIDLGKDAQGNSLNGRDDGGALDRYKQFCFERGIAPEDAQALISWQQGELGASRDALRETNTKALQERWPGEKYNANREQALVAVTALDRIMEGRLVPGFKALGLHEDATAIELMYVISTLIGEKALGGGGPGSGIDPNKPVSTEDAYSELFGQAK